MATTTQGNTLGDFLIWEADYNFSRDAATLISGQNLKAGTVLGKITASGKYTLHDNAAVDGSQNAVAVLVNDTDASAGDVSCAILARFATLKSAGLTFKAGITAPNKTAAIANLLTASNLKVITSA